MFNLVSVCFSAISLLFEKSGERKNPLESTNSESTENIPYDEKLLCYLAIFDSM